MPVELTQELEAPIVLLAHLNLTSTELSVPLSPRNEGSNC